MPRSGRPPRQHALLQDVRADLLVQSAQLQDRHSRVELSHEIADGRRQGGRRTFGTDVKRARGARLDRRGEVRGEENSLDFLAGQSQGRLHDTHDPEVGRHCAREGRRHTQAPAERGIVEELRREAFGDDRHVGYLAPIGRDKFPALNEVEPQGLEIVATGRSTGPEEAPVRPIAGIHSNGIGGVEGVPTLPEIAARQPGGSDSGKP